MSESAIVGQGQQRWLLVGAIKAKEARHGSSSQSGSLGCSDLSPLAR
jgi:hypothetical protein